MSFSIAAMAVSSVFKTCLNSWMRKSDVPVFIWFTRSTLGSQLPVMSCVAPRMEPICSNPSTTMPTMMASVEPKPKARRLATVMFLNIYFSNLGAHQQHGPASARTSDASCSVVMLVGG